MHAFVSAILFGMPRVGALHPNAQIYELFGQAAQSTQAACGKGGAVVA